MKKLSRIAALLAAAALLFGAAGCSGDDDDPPAKSDVTATLSAESIELEAGGEATSTATVTLAGGTFVQEVTKDSFVLTASGDSVVSTTAVELKSDTEAEIEFSVTAADKEESGEITVTVKAAALKDYGKDVTAAEKIAYTVEEVQLDPDFPSKTNDTTANDETTLGLVGTSATSSRSSVATAEIENGKIVITSHGTGTAVITVKDGDKEATIEVTVAADGTITIGEITKYEANSDDDDGEETYFTEFVAETVSDANVDTAKSFEAEDGTWSVTSAKYQKTDSASSPVTLETYDYADGTGYSYSGRIKVQKNGVFTIKTEAGTVLRIDGGSPSTGTNRTLTITGADKAKWTANTNGTFFLTATADTVTMTADGEFSIYGIHTAEEAVTPRVLSTEYSNLVVTLSGHSCLINAEVTAKATVTKEETTTEGSTTKTENVDVTADVSWEGATVTNGKVDTSNEGTLTITATYKYGDGANDKLTSAAVNLEVAGSWQAGTETISNADLGLTANEATSADEKVATAEKTDSGITIEAVGEGSTTVTVKDSSGNVATVDVTVSAGGSITTKVHKYAVVTEDKWTLKGLTTLGSSTVSSSAAAISADYEMNGESSNLKLLFSANGTGVGKTTNSPQYKSHNSGLVIKKDALKISGIKGSAKVTVQWGITSKKNENDRYLEITVGANGTTQQFSNPTQSTDATTTSVDVEGGTDGVDVYIGTSNELYFVDITVTAK